MKAAEPVITDRRNIWVFRYKPSEVLAAARERAKHHIERGKWWAAEHDKAEEHLKKKGFEYRERETSLDTHIQIVGDLELAQRVGQCRRKVADHRERQEVFETWARALKPRRNASPGRSWNLRSMTSCFSGSEARELKMASAATAKRLAKPGNEA